MIEIDGGRVGHSEGHTHFQGCKDSFTKHLQDRLSMPLPDQKWVFFQSQNDRIQAKEKEILTLKMKYAWVKTLLEVQGIIDSDISRGIFISRASGSSGHRVKPRIDEASSQR